MNTIKKFDITVSTMKNNFSNIKIKIVIKYVHKKCYKNNLLITNCYICTIKTLSIFQHEKSSLTNTRLRRIKEVKKIST